MASTPTSAADRILGTSRSDFIRGLAGNDTIFGYGGDDLLYGDSGSDKLYGGAGGDVLRGGAGNDYLSGGSGIDTLEGGDGNDYIVGGAYSDYMSGGLGSDRFVFVTEDVTQQDAWGNAILDFSQSDDDVIDFSRLIALSGAPGTLTFIGSAQFSGAGNEVRAEIVGNETIVAIDIANYGGSDLNNGDLAILLSGQMSLTQADFVF